MTNYVVSLTINCKERKRGRGIYTHIPTTIICELSVDLDSNKLKVYVCERNLH